MLTKEEKTLAENIRRLKEEQDLSYEKLAELSGVNYQTIHDFLNGRSSPKWINIRRIATALGLDSMDVLERPVKTRKLAKSA